MVVKIVMDTYLIIDFDSTFITGESLEWLADEALKSNPHDERKKTLSQIEEITRNGMEGNQSFEDSLRQRLALFKPSKSHIDQLVKRIEHSVTPSFERNREFIQQNAPNIRIVSGGFHEYMDRILESYGIPKQNISANSFIFDGNLVVGFDSKNILSKRQGKIEAVRAMNLDGKVIVIGDGYTDYEIVAKGAGDIFIAFTENISRGFVNEVHHVEAQSLDEVIAYVSSSYKERVV